MIPAGYLAKRISAKPDWLEVPQVIDIYSMSGCVSEMFTDYVKYWKHNGFWIFDSPEVIQTLAQENSIDLAGTTLFYYEVYEKEFGGETWHPNVPDESFNTNVVLPLDKQLEGFDVVTIFLSKFAGVFTIVLQLFSPGNPDKFSLLVAIL